MLDKDKEHYPKDPETLLRDVSVAIKLKDIKRDQILQERMSRTWWERTVLIVLFIATVGFLVTLATIHLSGQENIPEIVNYILYMTFGVMIISLIALLEILLERVSVLRQSHEIHVQHLKDLHKSVKTLSAQLEALNKDEPEDDSPSE